MSSIPHGRILAVLPPARPAYEAAWLSRLPACDVRIVHPDHDAKPWATLPLGSLFASTARVTRYADLEEAVRWADVVVTVEAYSSTTDQAGRLCRALRKPHAIIVWELIPTHPLYRLPYYRSVVERSRRAGARIVAVTQRAKEHLLQAGLGFDDVRVVYPAVSTPLAPRAQAKASGEGVTISFAGLLAAHKGILELVDAVRSLRGEGLDVRLSVAGEGPLRGALEHEPWLRLHGHLPPRALSALYASSDLFCLPARSTRKLGMLIGAEQFSYAVAEAMFHGLPCVVTDVGALSEVIGEGARAVPENDPQALREALRSLVASPQARLALGAYNSERAQRLFHPDAQAHALLEALFA